MNEILELRKIQLFYSLSAISDVIRNPFCILLYPIKSIGLICRCSRLALGAFIGIYQASK
jgi:hypothetical protein